MWSWDELRGLSWRFSTNLTVRACTWTRDSWILGYHKWGSFCQDTNQFGPWCWVEASYSRFFQRWKVCCWQGTSCLHVSFQGYLEGCVVYLLLKKKTKKKRLKSVGPQNKHCRGSRDDDIHGHLQLLAPSCLNYNITRGGRRNTGSHEQHRTSNRRVPFSDGCLILSPEFLIFLVNRDLQYVKPRIFILVWLVGPQYASRAIRPWRWTLWQGSDVPDTSVCDVKLNSTLTSICFLPSGVNMCFEGPRIKQCEIKYSTRCVSSISNWVICQHILRKD